MANATPEAPSFEKPTDFAASTVLLSASGVLMSGLGAPAFTPMPTPDRATSTLLPGTTLLCLTRSSTIGLVRMRTSAGAPSRNLVLSTAARP